MEDRRGSAFVPYSLPLLCFIAETRFLRPWQSGILVRDVGAKCNRLCRLRKTSQAEDRPSSRSRACFSHSAQELVDQRFLIAIEHLVAHRRDHRPGIALAARA